MFRIELSKCKKCAKSLRAAKGLIRRRADGYYEMARQPQNEAEVECMHKACQLCPFGAIIKTGETAMKANRLSYSQRGIELKVTGFDEHLCEYSNWKLTEFGIDVGSILIIDTHFQSKIVVEVEGNRRILGFEEARAIITDKDGERVAQLAPKEGAKVVSIEGGKEEYKRFKALGIDIGKKITIESFLPEGEELFARIEDENVVGIPPTKPILVKTNEGEKQLGLMKKNESGIITLVAASHGQEEEYDEKWIKEGSAIEILYIKNIERIPLMVTVKETGRKHLIGEGLADKIFVTTL